MYVRVHVCIYVCVHACINVCAGVCMCVGEVGLGARIGMSESCNDISELFVVHAFAV